MFALVVQFMAQNMSQDEVKGLKELFESMDTDHSGTISLDELRQGLQRRGVAVPEGMLRQIMDMADLNHNRCLDYEEFVGATMHVCKLQQEDKLLEAFKVRVSLSWAHCQRLGPRLCR